MYNYDTLSVEWYAVMMTCSVSPGWMSGYVIDCLPNATFFDQLDLLLSVLFLHSASSNVDILVPFTTPPPPSVNSPPATAAPHIPRISSCLPVHLLATSLVGISLH